MSDEVFRKYLINLLKTSKLYYINMAGQYVEYYTEDNKKKELNKIIEDIEWTKHLNAINNALLIDNNIPIVDNKMVICDDEKRLDELNKTKTISINNNSTLEEIANEISKMCDYEDYEDIDEDSKLYELKLAQERGIKYTLEFLKRK